MKSVSRTVFLAVVFLILPFSAVDLSACTSVIITGRLTADGRPLMLKHRDTGVMDNCVTAFSGPRFRFIGLTDAASPGGAVWSGVNEAGFSIINTASYNLKDDQVEEMDKEGELMYRALGECRNLADFEKLLKKLPRPLRVEANFGVIDSEGGAAYYEVNNTEWRKLDVNDPRIAPEGYLAVTNFSRTGRPDEGLGYIRYYNARQILDEYVLQGGRELTPAWIFRNLSRSFRNSLTGIDLSRDYRACAPNGWYPDLDFIPRSSSASSVVIQGVLPGENPELTVMWTVLGYPPLGVALPLFVPQEETLPAGVLRNAETGTAPYCDRVLEAKRRVFRLERGSGPKYLDFSVLFRPDGQGLMQQVQAAEDRMMRISEPYLEQWHTNGAVDRSELQRMYRELDSAATALYESFRRQR